MKTKIAVEISELHLRDFVTVTPRRFMMFSMYNEFSLYQLYEFICYQEQLPNQFLSREWYAYSNLIKRRRRPVQFTRYSHRLFQPFSSSQWSQLR